MKSKYRHKRIQHFSHGLRHVSYGTSLTIWGREVRGCKWFDLDDIELKSRWSICKIWNQIEPFEIPSWVDPNHHWLDCIWNRGLVFMVLFHCLDHYFCLLHIESTHANVAIKQIGTNLILIIVSVLQIKLFNSALLRLWIIVRIDSSRQVMEGIAHPPPFNGERSAIIAGINQVQDQFMSSFWFLVFVFQVTNDQRSNNNIGSRFSIKSWK